MYSTTGKDRKEKCVTVHDERILEVYEQNGLRDKDRLLVIFLFITKEERRHMRMHPEFCSADTTFGTEKSKKELFTLTFKNGDNKVLNGGRAYIPNAQRWVFMMMFSELLPAFWGSHVCERLRLLITDGCCNEYLSFIGNIGYKKSFPNAVPGLCYYHLVNQGYDRLVKPSLKKEGKEGQINRVFVPKIIQYIKTWYFDVETEAEYNLSFNKFFQWLDSLKKFGLSDITAMQFR